MGKCTEYLESHAKLSIIVGSIVITLLGTMILIGGCGGDNSGETKSIKLTKADIEKAKSKGLEYYQKGKNSKAIEELKKAAKGDPKDLHVQFSLAQAYVQEKKLDNAFKQYKEILKTDNKSADAHFGLGLILLQQNKLDEAIKELEAGAKLNKFFTSVRWSLAQAYTQKKEYKKAFTTYGELAKILDKDSYSLARIHFAQGEIYEKMGQKSNAKAEYSKAVELDKNYKEAAAKL
jgi:Tfp pilus assembly protein PilF